MKPLALLLAVPALALAAQTARAEPAGADPLSLHIAGVQGTLEPRAAAVIPRIDGIGRQLLALRSYVRAGAELSRRWSWSDAEIRAYAGSESQAALDAAIQRVSDAFAAANPGYSLRVNPEVRSLETQLERWNTNASVAQAAASLAEAAAAAVRSRGFPPAGTRVALESFSEFLSSWVPDPVPPLAAPGLSAHGQMRAVDFVVVRGEDIVAGAVTADIPAIWTGAGWSERLKAAVRASGAPFEGPLRFPDEPWHFDYRP